MLTGFARMLRVLINPINVSYADSVRKSQGLTDDLSDQNLR